MHELPIVESVIKIVTTHAKKHELTNVSEVSLVIGEFTGFVDESVEFYWGILAKDTVARSAKISIKRMPGKLVCLMCKEKMSLSGMVDECPKCGSFKLKVVGGGELEVAYIKGA